MENVPLPNHLLTPHIPIIFTRFVIFKYLFLTIRVNVSLTLHWKQDILFVR